LLALAPSKNTHHVAEESHPKAWFLRHNLCPPPTPRGNGAAAPHTETPKTRDKAAKRAEIPPTKHAEDPAAKHAGAVKAAAIAAKQTWEEGAKAVKKRVAIQLPSTLQLSVASGISTLKEV
jgi:hypothetical protein